jgi:hypothetical protein
MRYALGLGCTLLAATAAHAETAPICADRPAKANATCTVPPGDWQLESGLADWLRLDSGGVRADTLVLGSSLLKLGLSDRSDLELGITPYVRVSSGGDHVSGFGDVTLRYKHRLTGEAAAVQLAVIPFVKLPTAKTGIGNGKAEAGLALPISFALAGPLTATLGPEVDWFADADGHGRHPAIVQVVNLSAQVAPRLSLAAELWANWNFDPAGTVKQASADVAAAYAITSNFQVDSGANVGLTRDTSDIEIYAGASIRF